MRFIAWFFTVVGVLLAILAAMGSAYVAMLLALAAAALILPPVWAGSQRGGGARGAAATALMILSLGVTAFVVNNSPEGQALAAESRRLGQHCLDSDGSPARLVDLLKEDMGNPDSFKHVRTTITPADDAGHHEVFMRYRAENRFGGMSVDGVGATLDSECRVVAFAS